MILSVIEKYIQSKINLLNERYDLNIQTLQTDFITEFERIPANQSNNYYQINIDEINANDEFESPCFMFCNVRIEFSFFVGAKKFTGYKEIVNQYLFELIRILQSNNIAYQNSDYDANIFIRDISNINLTNVSKIENNYLLPSLNLVFNITTNAGSPIYSTENIMQ